MDSSIIFLVTGVVGLLIYYIGMGAATVTSAFLSAISLLVSGYAAIWVVDSLKGAWHDQPPKINDVQIEYHSCGFWDMYACEEHDVYLNHSYNDICKINAYASACVKNFMAVYDEIGNPTGQPRYLIDPWVPVGVNKNLLIKNPTSGRNYAESLDDAFAIGKTFVTNGSDNPGLKEADYAQFGIRFSNPQDLVLAKSTVDEIKAKAKAYAIQQKFFQEGDTDNLNAFADYTFNFHFLRPKLAKTLEISYPPVALSAYLDFMANGVSILSTGAGNAALTFGGLSSQYLKDLEQTMQAYNDKTSTLYGRSQQADIKKRSDNQRLFNELASNPSFNSGLVNLDQNTLAGAMKSSGVGAGTVLTADQSRFLKAIGTLRAARKEQLKQLDAYNKAVASNGNPDRQSRVMAAVKNYSSSFNNPLSSSRGQGFGSGGGSSSSDSSDKLKLDETLNKSSNGGFNGIMPAMPITRSTTKSPVTTTPSSVNNNAPSAQDAAAEEERRRIAEAIEARNKANKDKYSSNAEKTLFEQITNAYIRNYDKILTKKKTDKDLTEP